VNIRNKIRLCWSILTCKTGNLYAHAARELPEPDGDRMQEAMNRGLLDLVLVFSTQGHSGFSASYAVSALEKLLRFEPLRPLTGEDSEWVNVGDNMWQNNRCGHVFKDNAGNAYDIDGKIFREPDGACYTSRDSRVPVTFPYTPVREYVDVEATP
jgi:hypothetical protein